MGGRRSPPCGACVNWSLLHSAGQIPHLSVCRGTRAALHLHTLAGASCFHGIKRLLPKNLGGWQEKSLTEKSLTPAGPASDDAIKRKLGRLAPGAVGAVELRAIDERAAIVHHDGVRGLRLPARALGEHEVYQASSRFVNIGSNRVEDEPLT